MSINTTDTASRFIIRVYGIFIKNNREVLVSDEFMLGRCMTKFPGGGLEYGEGTVDCLKRECMEELGQEIEIMEHFYTTDYYQPAFYFSNSQLISIYYLAKFVGSPNFRISEKPFDFEENIEGMQSFRWLSIQNMSEADFTFPVDKKVAMMLKKRLEI